MKKVLLLTAAAFMLLAAPASFATATKPVANQSSAAVYLGTANIGGQHETLYLYGETFGGPCTLVKNANGEVVDARISFNLFCGVTFVLANVDGEDFFVPLEY